MHNRIFILLIVIIVLLGCDDNANGVSKSLVSTVEKLNSPDGQYSFYRYYVGNQWLLVQEV